MVCDEDDDFVGEYDECGVCDGQNDCFMYLDDGFYAYSVDGQGTNDGIHYLTITFILVVTHIVFTLVEMYLQKIILIILIKTRISFVFIREEPASIHSISFLNQNNGRDLEGYECFDVEMDGTYLNTVAKSLYLQFKVVCMRKLVIIIQMQISAW